MYGGSCFGARGRLETFGKSIIFAKNLPPPMDASPCVREERRSTTAVLPASRWARIDVLQRGFPAPWVQPQPTGLTAYSRAVSFTTEV
jgi:hypothetical protein